MVLTLRFFTCLVLTVCIVASVDATISCLFVGFKVAPCVDYLMNGGEVPPLCCFGVTSLNAITQTTPDRQQACMCLQSNAKLIPGLDGTLIDGLSAKCGLSIQFSMTTNCTNIK